MRAPIIDEQKTRNDLKSKRKLLFANFSKNPLDIRLALEIRLLDDRISDLDRNLRETLQGQDRHGFQAKRIAIGEPGYVLQPPRRKSRNLAPPRTRTLGVQHVE